MNKFKFFLITDTHYFASSLGCRGKEYKEFMQFEQKCFAETQSINEAAFAELNKTQLADTVLIAGDLSFNGEKQSHIEFLKLLKELKQSGKHIFVITAGHDFNDYPFAFDETGRLTPEGTKRSELYDMYYEYGFSEALSVERESLSYVAQLCDGVRLLALNNDGNFACGKTYTARQIEWILRQTAKAREDNQMLIAMNHYPLIAAHPVFELIGDAVMKNHEQITTLLADEGVHVCFTGHMHNQSIKSKITKKGNVFWDVCTGSLIGCPAAMRLVTVEDKNSLKIETLPVPDFDWDLGGLTKDEYFKKQFDMMINTYLSCLQNDPQRLLSKVGAGDKVNKKLLPVMSKAGEKLNSLTVGKLCEKLKVPCNVNLQSVMLTDLITDIVRNIFTGDAPYNEGTPEYDVIIGVCKKFAPVLNPIIKSVFNMSFIDLITLTIGHTGVSDYNAVINF